VVTVGEFLLNQIKALGLKKIFGIPGDMVIEFLKLVEDDPDLQLCTFSHEPAVGFAAVGAARATGRPAVACVTYGPGGLNMLNTVAGAYAEKTPLIVISGGPPVSLRKSGCCLLHHTAKDADMQLNVYAVVTEYAAVLDSAETATERILHAFAVCQETMLPVYIELPSDMINVPIIQPRQKQDWILPTDENAVERTATEIAIALSNAKNPVVMVGVEPVRYNLVEFIIQKAAQLNLPIVSTMLARDQTPSGDNYFGVYLGKAGNPDAKRLVEGADFVLMLGEGCSDVTISPDCFKALKIIWCASRQVHTRAHIYNDVPLGKLLEKVFAKTAFKQTTLLKRTVQKNSPPLRDTDQLITDDLIDVLNVFFQKHGPMPVTVDTGDCLFATLRLNAPTILGTSFYGTMGFAVPAAIGYAITTGKRPLCLVGDGAFQMTGQEISHCPRYNINPIFVVANNGVWGMEQMFHTSKMNQLTNWRYAELAELWGGKGYLCRTPLQLQAALEDAKKQQTFTLIEALTDATTPSTPLKAFINQQR
jgi:indolepyruvate decarboxylase